MRFGSLFLAGDAAHIVPPTGAKGLNLAASDVKMLYEAFTDYYLDKSEAGINGYSARALGKVWRVERFSWWLTTPDAPLPRQRRLWPENARGRAVVSDEL